MEIKRSLARCLARIFVPNEMENDSPSLDILSPLCFLLRSSKANAWECTHRHCPAKPREGREGELFFSLSCVFFFFIVPLFNYFLVTVCVIQLLLINIPRGKLLPRESAQKFAGYLFQLKSKFTRHCTEEFIELKSHFVRILVLSPLAEQKFNSHELNTVMNC